MSTNEFLSTYGGRNKNLPQTLTLDHVSPATRLLEKRRQMFEVQEALDAQKEEVSWFGNAFSLTGVSLYGRRSQSPCARPLSPCAPVRF